MTTKQKLSPEQIREIVRKAHLYDEAQSAQPADGVTYATKIDKAETRIDFTRPAREVHNRVRGLSPWPGAWLEVAHEGRSERIKVLRTALVPGGRGEPPGSVLDDALTIACALTNTFTGIRPVDVPGFVLAQLGGGLAATLVFHWLCRKPAAADSAATAASTRRSWQTGATSAD